MPAPTLRDLLSTASAVFVLVAPLTLAAHSAAAGPSGAPSYVRHDPSATVRQEPSRSSTGAASGVVTLVTGDRVRVTGLGGGRSTTAIQPGSPHADSHVTAVQTPSGWYVVPRLPLPERERLDASLFDVTALSRFAGGSIPVSVTFDPGIKPHAVEGLTLDAGSARRLASGPTVVAGRYDERTLAGRDAMSRWAGLRKVRLRGSMALLADPTYRMRTLTIHLTNRHGDPVRSELAWVENVDDAGRFTDPVNVVDGVATVSVPEGHYAVFTSSGTSVVDDPEFPVVDDTTISLTFADATMRPIETVPGHHAVDAEFAVVRNAEDTGAFTFLLMASRFGVRVQPTSPKVEHGAIRSVVSAAAASDQADLDHSLAYTKDTGRGIPDRMAFTHSARDFAVVPQRFYANGPSGQGLADAFALAPFEYGAIVPGYPVRVPGRRTIWLQASMRLTWQQDFEAIAGERSATLSKAGRYAAGPARPVNFAHGPVGPGMEQGYDAARTGHGCLLCRDGDTLRGTLPLFSGAGTAMQGQLSDDDMSAWSLRDGRHEVASGHDLIDPHLTLPSGSRRYTLAAVSHPRASSWRLSTKVSDTWRFRSRRGEAVVPLLIPSYLPPTTLDGSMRPGPTRLRLAFGNLGPVDAAVTRATFDLSTDAGTSWRRARVARLGDRSFAVSYLNPAANGRTRTVSLRVSGVDAVGRTVTETAIDAYRLVSSS